MTIFRSLDKMSVVDAETCPEGFEELTDNELAPEAQPEITTQPIPLKMETPNDDVV